MAKLRVLACVVFGIAGCANPGIPKAPSLRLPATVNNLTGERLGDRVELHWTSPSRTADGLDLTGATTVEICADPAPASQPSVPPKPKQMKPDTVAAACSPVLSMLGHPGESTALAPLPGNALGATGQLPVFAYRVRVLNAAGRSAAPSPPLLVPGGPSPVRVTGFQAAQQQAGVVLEWHKVPSTGQGETVEILRVLQTPQPNVGGAKSTKPAAAGKNSKSKSLDPSARAGRNDSSVSTRLRSGSENNAALAQGSPQRRGTLELDGMVDESTVEGATYTYAAQRVMNVSAAGTNFEVRSEPTPQVVVNVHDVFPPLPPTGLVGVPGNIKTPGGQQTGTIDLSWQANHEADLTGYFVYRADVEDGAPGAKTPVRLTPVPVSATSYRDERVVPGHQYIYVVTAIDRKGNESRPSSAFQSEL